MTLFSSVPTLSNPISVGGGRATYVNPWTFRVRRKLNFDDSESIELPKELEITRKPEITRKSEISKNSGISKNRKITIPRSVPLQEIKRQKSKFIDNSAVEEDADGVSLQSRETSPDKELPGKSNPFSVRIVVSLSVDQKFYLITKNRRSAKIVQKVGKRLAVTSVEKFSTTDTTQLVIVPPARNKILYFFYNKIYGFQYVFI